MIRGIYTAASALRAAAIHQGRLAQNLANLETTGFKQVLTAREAYELQRLGLHRLEDYARLRTVGDLENGLLVPPAIVDFSQGEMKVTERPLDVAIEGPGFFRVQTPEGERYTRDGSFHRDAQGRLVTVDGYFVLGDDGQPITLPPGLLTIGRQGTLFVDGVQVGQLGLVTFPDLAVLVPESGNLFRGEGAQPMDPATIQVRQGYLEGSNVDENAQVVEMMRILRLYEASQRSLQVQDNTLREALNVGSVT